MAPLATPPDVSADDVTSRNHLLAALPASVVRSLRSRMERVHLATAEVVYGPEQPIRHVYFPESAVVSMLMLLGHDAPNESGRAPVLDDHTPWGGTAVEVGTVGREGIVGLAMFLTGGEGEMLPHGASASGSASGGTGVRALVQVPGEAWCMPADEFAAVAADAGPLQRILLRYTQAYLAQVTQTAACNVAHRVEARCARWLLTTRDRTPDDRLPLTHTFLAAMLGVRETGVATALAALEARGLVAASRDAVRILDRDGLEGATCACYAAVRAEYARLLDPARRTAPDAAWS